MCVELFLTTNIYQAFNMNVTIMFTKKYPLNIPRQLNLELPNLEAYVEHSSENVKNILVVKHMENYELRH